MPQFSLPPKTQNSSEIINPAALFKLGFLLRCELAGLSDEEILDAATKFAKTAEELAVIVKTANVFTPVVASGLGYGIPLAIAFPIVTGLAGGYTLGKMVSKLRDVDADSAIDDIKAQDLIAHYESARKELEEKRKAYKRKLEKTPVGRSIL